MKSRALNAGLAVVASVWLGGAHAELVTDRVGGVSYTDFSQCEVLTCIPGAPADYYLQVGLQAAPAGFVASAGSQFDEKWPDAASLDGLISALNVTQLTLGTADGASQVVKQSVDLYFGDGVFRSGYSVGLQTASVTRDTSDSSLAAIGLQGGFTWSGTRVNGVLKGGSITFNDLRIDLDRQMVTADVRGQSLALGTSPSEGIDLNDIDLFTIGQIDGPSRFAPPGDPNRTLAESQNPHHYQATYSFSQLALTDAGLSAIRISLGLASTGVQTFQRLQQPGQIGSMSATLVYAPIPEPSTWWMMGVGLVGLLVEARRRKQSKEAS